MTPLDNALDNLLEQAYDAEQAGNLALAAALRAQYHSGQQQQQLDQAPPVAATEPPPHFAPFGALADGTPIMGEHDYTFPDLRTGCVWADVGRFSIVASADGLDTQSGGIDLEGATPDDLAALRSLLLSDTCDRLFAAARAWEDGALEPPTFAPPAASVQVEHWQGEDGALFTDLRIGSGLTKVLIGGYGPDPDKRGVELIIGGTGINEGIDEILTLSDVRQLRDNLTALLTDPRLTADPLIPLGSAPLVRPIPSICDDEVDEVRHGTRVGTDWVSGPGIPEDVAYVHVPNELTDLPLYIYLPDMNGIPLAKIEADLPHIIALLTDKRVQAERAAYAERQRQQFKRAA